MNLIINSYRDVKNVMKISRYTLSTSIDSKTYILYNILSKKYIAYSNEKREKISELIADINKGQYDPEEIILIKEMLAKGLITKDYVNELDKLEFEENRDRYNDQIFHLMILPTLDCNLRCVYCYEQHRELYMDTVTADNILTYFKKIIPNIKHLRVSWFGGEPLLGFKIIEYLSEHFIDMCNKYNVRYSSMMTTNGYSFSDDIIKKLESLKIGRTQITVDGIRDYHNKKRPHVNGNGTFDVIIENIKKLLENNILISLRVNIDSENFDYIEELLDIIPRDFRKKVDIDICNLYQTENKINTYSLYKASIEKGYNVNFSRRRFINCEACQKNGMVISPEGEVIPCSSKAEKGYSLGHINQRGEFELEHPDLYYKLKTASALKRDSCRDCIRLPLCVPQCKFKMIENDSSCMGKDLHGLDITDIIKLHYYSDLAKTIQSS